MSLLLQAAIDPKPLDIVALVQVTFTGLALLVSAIGGVYAAMAATRAKRAEEATKINNENIGKVQTKTDLIERNTNSMTTEIARLSRKEGEVAGERKGLQDSEVIARARAEGFQQGLELKAAAPASGAVSAQSDGTPVPVVDDKVAGAIEKSARAVEHVAKATEKEK